MHLIINKINSRSKQIKLILRQAAYFSLNKSHCGLKLNWTEIGCGSGLRNDGISIDRGAG